MRSDLLAIQVNHRVRHRGVKFECDLAAQKFKAPGDDLLVGEGALVRSLVKITEWQIDRIVRQADFRSLLQLGHKFRPEAFMKYPVIIETHFKSHFHSYFMEPSMPCTNWRCMAKKTMRVGSVASTAPTITTP